MGAVTCVVWGGLFERGHFYDYQIVSTYTTWTIVVVVFFFCLAISFFAVRTFLHVLHISLLMCHCIIQLSSCKCVFNKLSCQSSVVSGCSKATRPKHVRTRGTDGKLDSDERKVRDGT